jgi:hypothetical protein
MDPGVGRVHKLSSEPFVAVGVVGGGEVPYLLVLPKNTVSRDLQGANLRVLSSTTMTLIDEETEVSEQIAVTAIMFRSLSEASEAFLDILVDEAIGAEDPLAVGHLAEDFLDLFSPQEKLTRSELLGFWGELFVIWNSDDINFMADAWHSWERERYDFAFRNERLEVKTTEGAGRTHSFSSTQIPPPNGVNVLVASILTNEVQAGVSVTDLFESIEARLEFASGLRRF